MKLTALQPHAARLNEVYVYLKNNGYIENKKELADKLDYSYPHLVSMFSGKQELSTKVTTGLQKEYGINSTWLKEGTGKMVAGHKPTPQLLDSYFTENSIYHVPAENAGILMQSKAPDPVKGNLTKWCAPGLVGEYFSYTLETADLAPEYPKGCIIVVKRMPDSNWLIKGRHYVFATTTELTALRMVEPGNTTIKTTAGNYKRSDLIACYNIVLGVGIPIK